jgi:hypothetical protein
MATTGIKYSKNLDTAQIAKLVRADIKTAQKSGALPASLKTSVRISRYSGGSAIDIRVESAPFQIHASEFVAFDVQTRGLEFFQGQRFTKLAREVLAALEAIAGAYHRDDSDSQQDVYDVNFHLHVAYASDVSNADLEMQREYHEALAA